MNELDFLGPPPLTKWQKRLLKYPNALELAREKYKRWRSKPGNAERRRQYYLSRKEHWDRVNRENNRARRAAMTPEQLEEERRENREYKRMVRSTQEGKEKSRNIHKKWKQSKGVDYYSRPEIKARQAQHVAKYRERNWDKILAYARKRRTDPKVRLMEALRRRVNEFLAGGKSKRTMEYIGCSLEQLRAHLESQFLPHMNWSNHGKGRGKWQVDHIEALANIDPTDEQQVKKALHWSNLRPLWCVTNIRKGKKNGKAIGQMPLLLMEAAA